MQIKDDVEHDVLKPILILLNVWLFFKRLSLWLSKVILASSSAIAAVFLSVKFTMCVSLECKPGNSDSQSGNVIEKVSLLPFHRLVRFARRSFTLQFRGDISSWRMEMFEFAISF